LDAGGPGSGCNPEAGKCGRRPLDSVARAVSKVKKAKADSDGEIKITALVRMKFASENDQDKASGLSDQANDIDPDEWEDMRDGRKPGVVIDIKDILLGLQDMVEKEKILGMLKKPNAIHQWKPRPVVEKIKGKYFLRDGHHRVVARSLLGDTQQEFSVVDVDKILKSK
jgi:hypothetical protein